MCFTLQPFGQRKVAQISAMACHSSVSFRSTEALHVGHDLHPLAIMSTAKVADLCSVTSFGKKKRAYTSWKLTMFAVVFVSCAALSFSCKVQVRWTTLEHANALRQQEGEAKRVSGVRQTSSSSKIQIFENSKIRKFGGLRNNGLLSCAPHCQNNASKCKRYQIRYQQARRQGWWRHRFGVRRARAAAARKRSGYNKSRAATVLSLSLSLP